MLDNTIVLQVCSMSWNHGRQRFFWMIAGGRNLGINTARFVRLPLNRSNERQGLRYVNDLHLAIAQKMGATGIDRIGRADQTRGALDLGDRTCERPSSSSSSSSTPLLPAKKLRERI